MLCGKSIRLWENPVENNRRDFVEKTNGREAGQFVPQVHLSPVSNLGGLCSQLSAVLEALLTLWACPFSRRTMN